LDVHDVAVDSQQRLVFVNTLFSCLATVSEKHSFIPLWQPPFISRIAAEDRCHLNGLALQDKQPRYVTAVSQSDVAVLPGVQRPMAIGLKTDEIRRVLSIDPPSDISVASCQHYFSSASDNQP
jgi:hypothetical protein